MPKMIIDALSPPYSPIVMNFGKYKPIFVLAMPLKMKHTLCWSNSSTTMLEICMNFLFWNVVLRNLKLSYSI